MIVVGMQRQQELPRLTLLAGALTLVSMAIVVAGVAGVSRDLERSALSLAALSGAGIAWLLAATTIGAGPTAVITVGVGSFVLLTMVGNLGPEILGVGDSLLDRLGEVFSIGAQADWSVVIDSIEHVRQSLVVLIEREGSWLVGWISGTPLYDPIATELAWGAGLWMISAWAGWWVRRSNQVLIGLLPAAILLISTLGYLGAGTGAVLAFLGLTIVLIAVTNLDSRHRGWLRRKTRFSGQIWRGSLMWVAAIAAGLVVLAGLGQNFSLREGLFPKRYASEAELDQRETVADALGLRSQFESDNSGLIDARHNPGLPQRHLIGSGPELSEQVVMHVSVLQGDLDPERSYYRSATYDRYTGRGWQTSWAPPAEYDGGDVLPIVPSTSQRILHQRIEPAGEPDSLVYSSGELVTANRDFVVEWRGPHDPFGASLVRSARSYEVESLVTNATEEELRAAGQDYPDWILQDYFSLSAAVPARVLALGRRLTADEPTPYDRARALEGYLRTFEYTLAVPPPALGRDVADYFLFDLQRGYCDYYASSMVVLARAAGLPARLVVGYIGGSFEPELEATVVTRAESHSWVEIYFPDIGWVEFEPTGGRGPIVRESGAESVQSSPPVDRSELGLSVARSSRLRLGRLAGGFLLAVAAVPALWFAAEELRFARFSARTAALATYAAQVRLSNKLRFGLSSGDTPSERAATLRDRMRVLASSKAEAAGERIDLISEAYQGVSYRPDPALPQKRVLLSAWRGLRWRMWLAWVTNWRQRG